MSENQEVLINHWRVDTWFADLQPEMLKNLKLFHAELLKANKSIPLIPNKTMPVADALHFADCILASRVITKSNPKVQEIYDLGSGAGFPGLVFAITNPKIKVHLVENDPKKCEFLGHIIKLTKTANASVMHTSVMDLKENSMEFAMARGFSSISKVILNTRKSVKKGGIVYHLKGEEWGMEVSEIPIQLCSTWSPGLVGEYRLPIGEIKFSVIKTDKIA